MKKRILTVIMLGLFLLGIPQEVKAENYPTLSERNLEVGTNADTTHYYSIKNKKYVSTKKTVLSYLTQSWAKSSQYVLTESKTKTSSLSVSATSGTFTKSAVTSTGAFSVSYSSTFSVGTYIPADKSKYSKLAVKQEKKKYSADLYYVTNWGYKTTSSKKGSGYVSEPTDMYIEVVYK